MKGLTLVTVLMVLSGSAASATWRPGLGRDPVVAIAGLTAEQTAGVNELRSKHLEQTSAGRTRLNAINGELGALMRDPESNWSSIEQRLVEAEKIRLDLLKDRLEYRSDVRELLTDEQRLVFDSRVAVGPKAFGAGLAGGCLPTGRRFNRSRPMGQGLSFGTARGYGRSGCIAGRPGRRW